MNFSIPHWLLLLLVIIVALFFITFTVFFAVKKRVNHEVLRKHHDIAGFIIGTLGTLYSVLIGFMIVSSQDRYAEIITRVNEEAYILGSLYNISQAFPVDTRDKMQEGIKNYIRSVIDDEWPLMSCKKESAKTLIKMEALLDTYYQYEPKSEREKIWFAEAVSSIRDLTNARLARVYSSWQSIGPLSWAALIGGGIAIITLLFFFGSENIKAQVVINTLFSTYIVFMIFVIYALNSPFQKPEAITPKAYEVIYNYYDFNKTFISPEEMHSQSISQ